MTLEREWQSGDRVEGVSSADQRPLAGILSGVGTKHIALKNLKTVGHDYNRTISGAILIETAALVTPVEDVPVLNLTVQEGDLVAIQNWQWRIKKLELDGEEKIWSADLIEPDAKPGDWSVETVEWPAEEPCPLTVVEPAVVEPTFRSLAVGDDIAFASVPDHHQGTIIGFTETGKVEYLRHGKTLYADPGVIVRYDSQHVANEADEPELETRIVEVLPSEARAMTQAIAKDVELGEQIALFDRKAIAAGVESVRAIIQAGKLLWQAFDDKGRSMPWEDWLAKYCPEISSRKDSNYRRIARCEAEIEGWMAQQLEGGEPISQRAAIAYLKESKEAKANEGVPTWEELAGLFGQVGRVQQVGKNKVGVELPAWLEGRITGFPRVYSTRAEMWEEWQSHNEDWLATVAQVRAEHSQHQAAEAAQTQELETQEPAIEPTGDYWVDLAQARTLGIVGEDEVNPKKVELYQRLEDYQRAAARPPQPVPMDDLDGVEEALTNLGHADHGSRDPAIAVPEENVVVLHATPQSVATLKSSEKNGQSQASDRYTPRFLWEPGLEVFGIEEYDLDPMTDDSSFCTVPARVKYTKEIDGLDQPWTIEGTPDGVTYAFSNPAFHLNLEFALKLEQELKTGKLEMIMVNKHDHRTDWFNKLLGLCHSLCLVNRSVKFDGINSEGDELCSSFFPVSVLYFGHKNALAFKSKYSELGYICKPERNLVPF